MPKLLRKELNSDVPESVDTAPCAGCGMCCDGTLYHKAKAEDHEIQLLRLVGLSIHSDDTHRYFALPCRFSCEGGCRIYEQRFTGCRSFRCKLLRAYQSGEMTREEASEKVVTALELRSQVAAGNPAAASITARQDRRRKLRPSSDDDRLLVNIVALDEYLDRWFRNEDPKVLRSDEFSTSESVAADHALQDTPIDT